MPGAALHLERAAERLDAAAIEVDQAGPAQRREHPPDGLLELGRASDREHRRLRQQLAVHQRQAKRPKLRPRDRVFWVWLSRLWSGWRSVLVIVQPETVVGWHRQGFRLYWTKE